MNNEMMNLIFGVIGVGVFVFVLDFIITIKKQLKTQTKILEEIRDKS